MRITVTYGPGVCSPHLIYPSLFTAYGSNKQQGKKQYKHIDIQYQSVCRSRGQAVLKQLNGSTSCLGWRLLETQESFLYYMSPLSPSPLDEGCSRQPLPNYFGY